MRTLIFILILKSSLAFSAASADIQKTIALEAKGAGYSIVDSRKAGTIEGNSVYFYNKDGSVNRAVLKLTGSLGQKPFSDEIEASSLPADKECESPCSALESDSARKSLICSGTCSYGAPYLLTADEKIQTIFLAIANQAGMNAKHSVYSYSTKDKQLKIVGHFSAQTIKDAKFDLISHALSLNLTDSSGVLSTEKIEIKTEQ